MNDAVTIRESAPGRQATQRRLDFFAIAVRFQSVIGLMLVAIGGIIFSPRRQDSSYF